MTDAEIRDFVNHIEKMWLENYVAKRYLKNNCNIVDPTKFLAAEIEKIPKHAPLYSMFHKVRQAIGQGLQDTESFETLRKAVLESAKTPTE